MSAYILAIQITATATKCIILLSLRWGVLLPRVWAPYSHYIIWGIKAWRFKYDTKQNKKNTLAMQTFLERFDKLTLRFSRVAQKQHKLSFQARCSSLLQRRKALSGFTFVNFWQMEIQNFNFKTVILFKFICSALNFRLPIYGLSAEWLTVVKRLTSLLIGQTDLTNYFTL